MNDRRARARDVVADLTSDGTLHGTEVYLNGQRIKNLAAVDFHVGAEGSSVLISVGRAVIDYGAPGTVDVRGAPATVAPAVTPHDPD